MLTDYKEGTREIKALKGHLAQAQGHIASLGQLITALQDRAAPPLCFDLVSHDPAGIRDLPCLLLRQFAFHASCVSHGVLRHAECVFEFTPYFLDPGPESVLLVDAARHSLSGLAKLTMTESWCCVCSMSTGRISCPWLAEPMALSSTQLALSTHTSS